MFTRINTAIVIAWIAVTFIAFAASAKWLEGRIGSKPLVEESRLVLQGQDGGDPLIVYRPPATAETEDPADEPDSEDRRERRLELKTLEVEEDNVLDSGRLVFHRNPALLVWAVLASGMVGLAAALLPLLFYTLKRLRDTLAAGEKRLLRSQYGLLAASVMAIAGVGLPVLYSAKFAGLVPIVDWYVLLDIGMPEPLWTVRPLQFLTATPGVLALFGMFVASSTADDLGRKVDAERAPLEHMERILQCYRDANFTLRLCLASASALLVMTILTAGALREALLTAAAHEHPWLAPTEFLYLYGLLFGAVLAMFYLPIYFHVRVIGKRIFARLRTAHHGTGPHRLGDDGDEDDAEGAADEKDPLAEARAVLTGQESVGNKLLSWISIAAPVLGTILPDLVSL